MKKYFLLSVVAVLALTAPAVAEQVCSVGLTKVSIGAEPFSWVLDHTGVVSKMTCVEAKFWADVLNARHNNDITGVEPVTARVYQG